MLKTSARVGDSDAILLAKVSRENNERERIENNVVVAGLVETSSNNDESIIEELAEALDIDKSSIKFHKRLKKRGANTTNNTNPPLLLIQFNDKNTQRAALSKSKDLRQVEKFSKVFINQDRTESQRKLDKQLRDERKKRNAELPETLSDGRTYRLHEGKKYYWGIRNDQLRWVELGPL